jgi:hypothetical protein
MTADPKKKTLLVAILDESGSMGTKRADVIGGFNTFLTDQKKLEADDLSMVLAKFNTVVSLVHKAVPIGDVQPLTPETYTPGGMTAPSTPSRRPSGSRTPRPSTGPSA